MKQQTLAVAADQNAQYEQYRRPTRRDVFLTTMEQIVPWAELCEVIEPHYPKAGNGRPPVGLERMLRMYFVQHWFNLADAACEDALLDSTALRRFVGIDLGRERVPDATTLLKFRRLLEKHKLGEALFAKVGEVLQANGLKVGTGTIVDATIIGAPSSTKNKDKKRDPEMHQTQEGQAMVLRHEVAHRRGQPDRPGAQRGRHGGQRARQAPAARSAAWPGGSGLWRLRIRLAAGPDPFEGAGCSGLDQPEGSQGQRDRGARAHGQPREVEGARPGRARLRCRQAAVGLRARCATAAWPRTPRARSSRSGWPTSSWRAGACWHECVCMARRVRPMRGERANSRQLASQDTARAAIGHPCGYELQFAGLISFLPPPCERRMHHGHWHRPTPPRAARPARTRLSRLPRRRRDGQVAAALRLHLQGPPHGRPGRRDVQDVVHELRHRQRPLVRRRVPGAGPERDASATPTASTTPTCPARCRPPSRCGRCPAEPSSASCRKAPRGHPGGGVLPRLAGVAGQLAKLVEPEIPG